MRVLDCKALCLLLAIVWPWLLPLSTLAQQNDYEIEYQKARRAFYRFRADDQRQQFRHHWQKTARLFEKVARKFPTSPRADDALFTAARLYYDLHRISRVTEDLEKSEKLFRKLIATHSTSSLADDSQLSLAMACIEFRKNTGQAIAELTKLIKSFPKGDVTPRAKRMLEDLGGSLPVETAQNTASPPNSQNDESDKPVVTKIKTSTGPDYTRVIVHTQHPTKYKFGLLKADQQHPKPRLYVDLQTNLLDPEIQRETKLTDSLVHNIRVAPHSEDTIRVVLDLHTLGDHKVFPMDHPARVVIDVSARDDKIARIIGTQAQDDKRPDPSPKASDVKDKLPAKSESSPKQSLSMLAGLKIKTIVIDPGHGGRDPGALGPKKTMEKDITLDIAKRLSTLLEKDKALELSEIVLTRKSDRFVDLEKRTAIANAKRADLFISIHCNAHRSRRFRGVETFYLDLTNDRYSIKLAARENATSEKTISDLQFILADLALKSHVDDSISLGHAIQKGMIGKLRRKYKDVKDLSLKPALFYVLIGARMPSVLVETSFISNPMEERRLRTKTYRQQLAEGIYAGIRNIVQARKKQLDPDS